MIHADIATRRRALLPVLLALFLLALAAPPAAAQEPDSTVAAGAVPGSSAAEEHRFARLARMRGVGEVLLLGESTAHALTAPLRWNAADLRTLGLGAGGVALVSLLDGAGREAMARNHSAGADRLEEVLEPFGRERGLQLMGGFFAAGLVLDDARLRAVAAEGLASGLVAAGVIQPALAEITGRPRPRTGRGVYDFDPFSGNISFPSGHTTAAFALASVIATEYPHPAVQGGAYGIAAGVGLARMYRGAHYASDVLAAAAIGTAVGRGVARFGQRHRARLRLAPELRGEDAYLVVRLAR